MKSYAKVLTLAAILVAAVGCSKEPVEEIQSVNQAMEEARTEMVRIYAPESLEQAEKAAADFNQQIAAEKDKWFFQRDYDQAKQMAVEAREAAEAAVADAGQAKEEVRQEARRLIEQAGLELQAAESELGTAPVGKGNKAEIEAMKMELQAAREKLADVEASMQAEQYQEAKVMAEQVIDTAQRITDAVRTAREMKASGGRRT